MKTRRALWAVLGLGLCTGAMTWTLAHTGRISGTPLDMDLNRKTMVHLHREAPNLQVELLYFPSFESTFEEPEVSRDSNGNAVIRLRSYSSGPFHRKSEQLTNISFTVPSQAIEPGATIQFFSGDYDQVFAIAKAP